MTQKAVITVLGQDRPGIIAAITRVLMAEDCNIENVSQTILQTEFAGIFIVSMPDGLERETLATRLRESGAELDLHVGVKPFRKAEPSEVQNAEPFVVTTRGPDRRGLVAAMAGVMARFGVNITNLQAVFAGGDDPNRNVMIYEVDVNAATDKKALDDELRRAAADLGLEISIQHRDIFQAINRV